MNREQDFRDRLNALGEQAVALSAAGRLEETAAIRFVAADLAEENDLPVWAMLSRAAGRRLLVVIWFNQSKLRLRSGATVLTEERVFPIRRQGGGEPVLFRIDAGAGQTFWVRFDRRGRIVPTRAPTEPKPPARRKRR